MSIQRLTRLKSLKIYGCTELGKCCQKETGEDWQKIAHVQDIEIQNWVVHISEEEEEKDILQIYFRSFTGTLIVFS